MVLGARNSKGEGHTSRIHQSDEEQTSSTGRPLGFPLRNSSEAEPSAAAVTSSATVSGEEGGEASGEEEEEEGETSGKTEEAWGDDSDTIGGGGRPRLRAGAEEGGRAKSASVSTIVTNTTVATRRSRNGCSRRAWKTSGRCVVAVRKAMTSRVDPWTVRGALHLFLVSCWSSSGWIQTISLLCSTHLHVQNLCRVNLSLLYVRSTQELWWSFGTVPTMLGTNYLEFM